MSCFLVRMKTICKHTSVELKVCCISSFSGEMYVVMIMCLDPFYDRMKMICASIMEFSWHLQQQFVFEKLQSVCGTHVSGGILITGFYKL